MSIEVVIDETCPINEKRKCERMGTRDGKDILIRCRWYQPLKGKHPQTGADIDEFGCSVEWVPTLLCENSMEMRHTTASVDKLAGQINEQHYQGLLWFKEVTKQNAAIAGPPKQKQLGGHNGS